MSTQTRAPCELVPITSKVQRAAAKSFSDVFSFVTEQIFIKQADTSLKPFKSVCTVSFAVCFEEMSKESRQHCIAADCVLHWQTELKASRAQTNSLFSNTVILSMYFTSKVIILLSP